MIYSANKSIKNMKQYKTWIVSFFCELDGAKTQWHSFTHCQKVQHLSCQTFVLFKKYNLHQKLKANK